MVVLQGEVGLYEVYHDDDAISIQPFMSRRYDVQVHNIPKLGQYLPLGRQGCAFSSRSVMTRKPTSRYTIDVKLTQLYAEIFQPL